MRHKKKAKVKEKEKSSSLTGKTLKYFWKKTQAKRGYFWLMLISRVGAAVLAMITPLLLKNIIDLMVTNSSNPSAEVVTSIGIILIWWVIVAATEWLSWRIFDIGIINLEVNIIKDIYLECFDYVQRHSHQFFANTFSGALVKKIGRLARGYESFVDMWVFEFLPIIITTGIGIGVLFNQDVRIGCIFVGWLIIHVTVQVFLYKRKFPYDLAANAEDSKLTGHLADVIGNHATINSFGSYQKEYKSMEKRLLEWRNVTRSARWKHPVIGAIAGCLIVSTQVSIVFYMVDGRKTGLISVGTILLIQLYVLKLFDRLMFVGNSIKKFYQTVSESAEMLEILQTSHEIQDYTNESLLVKDGKIVFRNVDFAYGEAENVFNNLSLSIKSGERVAFVGESGSGKTTITKLLLRLYDIQSGEILIDGQNIAQVTQESLREYISLVPQDPILFHRTLKENIAYGRDDVTDEEIIAASKMARCHKFIEQLSEGYDSLVGERGVKLSGGERQRVAIARAILANKPILIMDEATSALDSESESLIQEAMNEVMKNKTVIVIAHRLSTVMKMDRIVVMDQGKIIEEGSHNELLLKETGTYKKLRNIQSGSFEE